VFGAWGMDDTLSNFGTSLGLYTSALGAHLTWTLPFGLLIMFAIFNRFNPAYEEAARDLGATPWQGFAHVVLPLIAPGILAGVLLSGASSMMLSLVSIAMGPPAGYAALSGLTASPILAVIGIALLLCAVVLAAMTLLRR